MADDEEDRLGAEEETPLLTGTTATAVATDDDDTDSDPDPRDAIRARVLVLVIAIAFLLEVTVGLSTPAWNALIEENICRELNPADVIVKLPPNQENPLCKGPAVQSKLAMIRGLMVTVECIPGLLFSIPYGVMSDQWGRRPILFLSFFGTFLALAWIALSLAMEWPTWSVLLLGVFMTIGGSSVTGVSMLYTSIADVVPPDDLATVLFYFFSMFMLAELISTPLSGYLLSIHLFLPVLVGLVAFALSLILIPILPETVVVRRWHDERTGRSRSVSRDRSGEDGTDGPKKTKFANFIEDLRTNAEDVGHFILGNKRVVVLMLPLIFVMLGRLVQDILLQYATKRYHWSWTKAAYTVTLKTVTMIVLCTVILPLISKVSVDVFKMTPLSKDLWITRWSSLLLVFAAVLLAFAVNPVIFVLGIVTLSAGGGFPLLIRSLLNSLVEPHHVGIMNTLIGFLETIGLIIAGPALGGALGAGLKLGGLWAGLPFMIAGFLFAISTIIVFTFQLPPKSRQPV